MSKHWQGSKGSREKDDGDKQHYETECWEGEESLLKKKPKRRRRNRKQEIDLLRLIEETELVE